MALKYDPSVLSVTTADITLGSLTQGWQIRAALDVAKGEIGIELWSDTPIAKNDAGSLVNIAFRTNSNEALTETAVQLASGVTVQGDSFVTLLADGMGSLVVSSGVRSLG